MLDAVVALTRAMEVDGTLELLRSCGLDPAAPLRAALAILTCLAGVLAVGSCLASALAGGSVDGVTWASSAALGAVVGLTFLLTGTLTVALTQVAPTAPGARALAFAAVGVAFAVRAFADTQDVETAWQMVVTATRKARHPAPHRRTGGRDPPVHLGRRARSGAGIRLCSGAVAERSGTRRTYGADLRPPAARDLAGLVAARGQRRPRHAGRVARRPRRGSATSVSSDMSPTSPPANSGAVHS